MTNNKITNWPKRVVTGRRELEERERQRQRSRGMEGNGERERVIQSVFGVSWSPLSRSTLVYGLLIRLLMKWPKVENVGKLQTAGGASGGRKKGEKNRSRIIIKCA